MNVRILTFLQLVTHTQYKLQKNPKLKVALSQEILETFHVSNINIPNHYPEQKIWILFIVLGGKFKFSA